jgi:hypothetical protein
MFPKKRHYLGSGGGGGGGSGGGAAAARVEGGGGGGGMTVKDSRKNRTLNPIHKEYRKSSYFHTNFSVCMGPYRKIK